ncbi:MAG: hypothetical protein IIA70_00800 [Proteobacteria bacterium]|nr:hypothetical protein [Pseudomonadota bacterium]
MGFIGRLWRGRVSLGITYWIFGALVVFMFQMLEFVPMENPDQAGILIFISTAYYFFISIAVFRSSLRHNGSRLFIVYAQLSVVALLMIVLWRIVAVGIGVEGIIP